MYLYWPIPLTHNLQLNPLASLIQLDPPALPLHGDHCPGLLQALIHACFGQRELVVGRHGQEGPVQRFLEISVVAADRVMYGDEVRAGREGPLDHEL